jgi:hypothetical protein
VAAVQASTPKAPPLASYAPPPPAPITLNVQVDGQTLATAVHKANADAASRSFSPVPSY